MKNFLINCALLLLFLCGMGLILYPTISNMINERNQSEVITRFEEEIDHIAEQERIAAIEAAHAYNEDLPALLATENSITMEQNARYLSTLNLTGNGIMGALRIDKIRVNLPIYHGTSDAVLQVAVGHLPATSLPVGGENTHAVLSAHTGLPSARLFTDLDRLETGDIFMITIPGETLVYQVDQICVVEPEDAADLRILEGGDYVTLVTCTPYGINSHRLLVRGTRIYPSAVEQADMLVKADAVFLDKLVLVLAAVFPTLLICIFADELRRTGKRRR